MKNIENTLTDSMVSDDYEIYCVEDLVDEDITQYHSHDFYEIHITLSGEALFYLDGGYHKIKSGSVLLIHHGDLHRICSQNSTYFERVFIYLTPSFLQKRSTKISDLEKCFTPIGNSRSKILDIDVSDIINYLKVFIDDRANIGFGTDLIFEQNLINFLIYINKCVINEKFELLGGRQNKNQLIDDVIQYVNANLNADLSLSAVSDNFFISKFHLAHKFKEITDMTFHNFVLKKRLIYSKQLLRKYKNSSRIYSDCGFSSYSYFLKCFKKEYGITPKEFINMTNANNNLHFNDSSYR